jgi:hypothetical protein
MAVNHHEKGLNFGTKLPPMQIVVHRFKEEYFRMPPPSQLLALDLCGVPIESLEALDGHYDTLFEDSDILHTPSDVQAFDVALNTTVSAADNG